MKVVALTVLMYGEDYLASAIRSVIESVNEYVVLYTPVGSHGSRTDIPCPESRDTLYNIALEAAGNKLRWYEGTWANEGAQRDYIHTVAPDADLIVVLDADEIWPADAVDYAIGFAAASVQQFYRVPMVHFWRSFNRAVIDDGLYPIRIIKPEGQGETTLSKAQPIAHMGYAQNARIVEFKQLVHGHKHEWRKGWYESRFLNNMQRDVHPVIVGHWNPQAVQWSDYLPEYMQYHPYFGLRIIK